MPPRKRPSQESPYPSDGDADEATAVINDKLVPPRMNAATKKVMNSIGALRCDFVDLSKKSQQAHAEKLAELEERFMQRLEEEQTKRETRTRELLVRLDRAIQKKAACEEAMMQAIASVKQDTEAFQLAIGSVYADRLQQCQEGVELADQAQQAGGMPLMQGEHKVRARMEKLME
ncbi:hypothetical protein PG993_000795 [Apiospora rasikravindrae]|uniref:Uncharacterized protein n=1 Tax=Apiospora rasikravindrae TaxID=990691 RepID=A0ABR1U9J5_9PEZI